MRKTEIVFRFPFFVIPVEVRKTN